MIICSPQTHSLHGGIEMHSSVIHPGCYKTKLILVIDQLT